MYTLLFVCFFCLEIDSNMKVTCDLWSREKEWNLQNYIRFYAAQYRCQSGMQLFVWGGSLEIMLTFPWIREYFRKCEEKILDKELDQLKILNQQLKKRLEETRHQVKSLTDLYIRAIQRGDVVWKSSLPDYVTEQGSTSK